MPLFHFNSLTGDLFLPDPEGEELPNVDSAREVAEQSAREALIEAVKSGDIAPDCIQVTDNEGREVLTVFSASLLDIKLSARERSQLWLRAGEVRKLSRR
jgi:hypothetical protein